MCIFRKKRPATNINALVDNVIQATPTQNADSCTVSGHIVHIPAGYYPSDITASVSCAQLGNISVSTWLEGGHVSITFYQETGYCEGGERIASALFPTCGATVYIPSTNDQIIPKGVLTAGEQIIKGDPNLLPENIREGVEIFGVVGTYK